MDIRKKSNGGSGSQSHRKQATINNHNQRIGRRSSGIDLRSIYSDYRTPLIALSVAVIVVVLLIGALNLFRGSQNLEPEQRIPFEQASEHFNPLLPTATENTGSSYSFDAERNMLSFNAQYEGVALTISQQAFPEAANLEEGELANLARQIGAESTIETDMGVAYITPQSESSGQTALFASDDALIFIRSDRSLSDQLWQDYINQLESA